MIRGLYKNSSFSIQLLVFFAVFLMSLVLASAFYAMIARPGDGFLRLLLLINQGAFIFSALFSARLLSENLKTGLKIGAGISPKVIIYIILSMLVVSPFLNLTVELNESIRLPEWMKPVEDWMIRSEQQAKQLTDSVINTGRWTDLIANLFIIGLLAAIGEELLFRGVLQNIFRKKIVSEHLVIWLVAIIFSAIHLQFYGFLPRMLMGAWFGYLLYYTGSMWAPVLAHFVNNALVVLLSFKAWNIPDPESLNLFGTSGHSLYLALISFILWAILFYLIKKNKIL